MRTRLGGRIHPTPEDMFSFWLSVFLVRTSVEARMNEAGL